MSSKQKERIRIQLDITGKKDLLDAIASAQKKASKLGYNPCMKEIAYTAIRVGLEKLGHLKVRPN